MKKTFFIAAASLMVALLTACSGSDDATSEVINPQQPQSPTAGKVILKGTLTNDETRSTVTNEGVATWSTGDKIAVRYQTANGYAMAEATVEAGGSANATFTATLDNPKGGAVQLIYPASLYQETAPYYSTDKLLTDQVGTLVDVGANWNIQTAEATMTIDGSTASLAADVDMQSQVSLLILNLKKDDGSNLSATKLEITAGSDSYTITPAAATNSFAVAMKPVSGANFTFAATSTESGIAYTLEPSLSLSNVTNEHVGHVFDKDGNIYSCNSGTKIYMKIVNSTTLLASQYYTSQLQLSDIQPVAMIAYVGEPGTADGSSGAENFRGLAMAMDNANNPNTYPFNADGNYHWAPQDSYQICTGVYVSNSLADHRGFADMNGISNTEILANHTCDANHSHPAAKAAKDYSVAGFTPSDLGCSSWFLPSSGQWCRFLDACGVDLSINGNWGSGYGDWNRVPGDYVKTASVMNNAGANYVSGMWSSSQFNAAEAVIIEFSAQAGVNVTSNNKLLIYYKTRPFLAF